MTSIRNTEPERRFLADAERRLVQAKRTSFALFAVILLFAGTFFYLTRNQSSTHSANPGQSPSHRGFVVLAAVVYGAIRAAVRIRKASHYVAASRRALADAEAGEMPDGFTSVESVNPARLRPPGTANINLNGLPLSVLQALSEAAAWCSRRQLLVDELRSPELDPSDILNIPDPDYSNSEGIHVWGETKRDRYRQAVAVIQQRRSKLLRDANITVPEAAEVRSKGRLLLYETQESVADEAAAATSKGFFDGEDAPPWDTWFLYENGTIYCWVPETLTQHAQAGIDANPVDCIHWAKWSALNRVEQSLRSE